MRVKSNITIADCVDETYAVEEAISDSFGEFMVLYDGEYEVIEE